MNEKTELQLGDIVEINEDCLMNNGAFLDGHVIWIGKQGKVTDVIGRTDLVEVKFRTGPGLVLYVDWVDFVERPTPNDTTRYECDLFAWAGVQV